VRNRPRPGLDRFPLVGNSFGGALALSLAVDALATPEDRIATLPHRTLVVHGRDDRVIPVDNAFRLIELIDDAQLHVFGRCGYWTQIERSAELNRLVGDFLA
jgi:pimeloyl-ACP methyl ester carboxylesterase